MVFLSLFRFMLRWYLKIGQDYFVPHTSHVVIHSHPTIWCFITTAAEKILSNNLSSGESRIPPCGCCHLTSKFLHSCLKHRGQKYRRVAKLEVLEARKERILLWKHLLPFGLVWWCFREPGCVKLKGEVNKHNGQVLMFIVQGHEAVGSYISYVFYSKDEEKCC